MSTTTLYTPAEASERLPYCARTLVRFAREGRIGHVRLGQRKIRFRDEDIEGFIKAGAVTPHKAEAKPSRNPKYASK